MTTIKLSEKVYVKREYRLASSGRQMESIDIIIDCVGGGKYTMNTLWCNKPYPLPYPVISRIKNLVIAMIKNGYDIEVIKNHLQEKYYEGFPQKQQIGDFDRFVIKQKRNQNKPIRKDGYYNLKGEKSNDRGSISWLKNHYISKYINGEWVSSPVGDCPANSISNLKVGEKW